MHDADFREILDREYARRCDRNPAYSLRAYARDLGLSPARLCEVLKKRGGLSPSRARMIATRLGLHAPEIRHFCDLVESEHARSESLRARAKERLRRAGSSASAHSELELSLFSMISDWYHLAVLELAKLPRVSLSARKVSERLGLPLAVAESAVKRLGRLGFLVREGARWRVDSPNYELRPRAAAEAVRRFHAQLIEKAKDALVFQSVAERDFSSVILQFDSRRVAQARERIERFRKEFDEEFGLRSEGQDSVYCLAVQLFRLTQGG